MPHAEPPTSDDPPCSPPAAADARGRWEPSRGFVATLAVVYFVGALVLLAPESGSLESHGPSAIRVGRLPLVTTFTPVRPAAHRIERLTVDSAALEYEVVARHAHVPLARVLGRRVGEPELADRIASAIVREARRLRVAPSLLAGVLLTENPELEADVISSQGAMGLMQVMPFHAGEYGCESADLLDPEANICHGAWVFGQYMRRAPSVEKALLRYNGCVASVNTPNCERYPDKVMRKAGQVRRMMLRYAGYGD